MPSDPRYLVHVRLTRQNYRRDIIAWTKSDRLTYAVNSWKQLHPDVAVGDIKIVPEGIDAYAEIPVATARAGDLLADFVTWITEAPAHVHECDDSTSLPGALTTDQLAALIPGSPVEFLLEGTWYPGKVHATDLIDSDGDLMLIVDYTGPSVPNPKIPPGRMDPGDGFWVYPGEVRAPGAPRPPIAPPRPTVHVVRDALIRVHGAASDSGDASDTYEIEIDGVKIAFGMIEAGTDGEDAPTDAEPTAYVRLENIGRAKGTRLVIDVNGNQADHRF